MYWLVSQVVQQKRTCQPMQEIQETWVQFLGGEDPLEEEMATHFSILAWKIPQREDLRGYRAAKSWTRMSTWTCTQSCKYCWYLCLTNGETSWLLVFSHPILSDSLWPHGVYTPWNSLGQYTGVGSVSLFQVFFFFFWLPTYFKTKLENSCLLFNFK